jgi:hypothetical protein
LTWPYRCSGQLVRRAGRRLGDDAQQLAITGFLPARCARSWRAYTDDTPVDFWLEDFYEGGGIAVADLQPQEGESPSVAVIIPRGYALKTAETPPIESERFNQPDSNDPNYDPYTSGKTAATDDRKDAAA